jgi:hypothetical protein
VTREGAIRDYGVVLDDGFEVDAEATERRRDEMQKADQ